jgi:hypothetical protein
MNHVVEEHKTSFGGEFILNISARHYAKQERQQQECHATFLHALSHHQTASN